VDWGLFIGLAGFFVSLVGIPLAFYLARRSRQKPDLRFARSSEVVLEPFQEGDTPLHVAYGATEVTRVSRGRVAFWSRAGDTVRGTDVVSTDALRVTVPTDCTILQAKVITQARQSNGITLELAGKHEIKIGFDFLDAGDGFVLEVLYDGSGDVGVAGTIRGATVRDREADLSDKAIDTASKPFLRRIGMRDVEGYSQLMV
jgi:hypothetical protein